MSGGTTATETKRVRSGAAKGSVGDDVGGMHNMRDVRIGQPSKNVVFPKPLVSRSRLVWCRPCRNIKPWAVVLASYRGDLALPIL